MLKAFQDLAETLSKREKITISIHFKNKKGRSNELKAEYDPLFKTIKLGGAIMPAIELGQWMKLLHGAMPDTIRISYLEQEGGDAYGM